MRKKLLMGTNRLYPKEMVITTTDHQHTFGLTQDITTKVSSEPGKKPTNNGSKS